MTTIGQIERATQNRIVKLFREQLGYDYLGNWEERSNNQSEPSPASRVRKPVSVTSISHVEFCRGCCTGTRDNVGSGTPLRGRCNK